MPDIEITDLRLDLPAGVRGHIDRPKQGTRIEAAALDLVGWALGDDVSVVAVELVRDGTVFRRLAPGVSRPDLAAAFPDSPGAGEAGFRSSVSLLGSEPELSLELRAVLADQRRVPFATIRAKRRWRESSGPERDLVSVVIPCYDQAHFLGEAIESVLAQSYPHLELLVVDDGSHDNTAAVAARYPGVRYLRQRNKGLAAARNTGIRHTYGDYLVFLDSDDRLLAHALETGVTHMREHPEAAFVSGRWRLIGFDGLEIDTPEPAGLGSQPYRSLLTGCLISSPAVVMYRRKPLEALGGFDRRVDASADYDVYLRLARRLPIAFHDEIVAEYRRHGSNMTLDASLILRTELAVLRRQRRYARKLPGGEEAYRKGRLRARKYHGAALKERAAQHYEARRWAELARVLGTLARHDRRRLLETLSSPPRRRANGGDRRSNGLRTGGPVDLGSLRRLDPISDAFGFDRGLPIDRHYIESFLGHHEADIQQQVLEIGESLYTRTFGGRRVTSSDVLHVEPGNPQATIVGDLADADSLPSAKFDCIILTQTLQLIYDVPAAVRSLNRMLKPEGVLLATVPGITQRSSDEWAERWCWSFTSASVKRLFEESFDNVKVEAHGNVLTASSMLYGLASEELTAKELNHVDPRFPVTITVRAVKRAPVTARRTPERRSPRSDGRSGRPLILLYHRVADLNSDPWSIAVSPDRFREQLAVLREWGTPVDLEVLARATVAGALPEQAFAVTFDDGYRECAHVAADLLAEVEASATFFVTAGALDDAFWWDQLDQLFLAPGTLPDVLRLKVNGETRGWNLEGAGAYSPALAESHRHWRAWEKPPTARHAIYRALWDLLQPLAASERSRLLDDLWTWSGAQRSDLKGHRTLSEEELRQLARRELVQIGSHGMEHSSLASLSHMQQREDIFSSKSRLEEMLDAPVRTFSYPYGKEADYSQAITQLVREAGFRCAVTGRPAALVPGMDAFALPRIHVHDWTADEFEQQLRGFET